MTALAETDAAATVPEYRNLIAGEWCAAETGATFENRNPADRGDLIGRFAASTAADAERAVAAAHAAFPGWRATPIGKRAAMLETAAAYLEAHAEAFGHELTREEGKLLGLGVGRESVTRRARTLPVLMCGRGQYPDRRDLSAGTTAKR